MYCNHFGFAEKPFDVTPDPRFLYLTPDHRETLASLLYGIRERRGFVTIVGEVGTGKTTLLNAVLDRLDKSNRVAFIFNTNVTFGQLLNLVLYELGLTTTSEHLSKIAAIHRLNRFAIRQLARSGSVVIIIDEAHNLSTQTMENLRLLSNLETRKHKLIQIVLSGQPELDVKLANHELRQFTQRISLRRYVSPLNESETYAYLQHRLNVSGYKGSSLFVKKAEQLIWDYSLGIPRKINILCDNALLIGYGLKQKKIQAAAVQEAAEDMTWGRYQDVYSPVKAAQSKNIQRRRQVKIKHRRFAFAAAAALAGCLLFATGYSWRDADVPMTQAGSLFQGVKTYIAQKIDLFRDAGPGPPTPSERPVPAIVVGKIKTEKTPALQSKPEIQAKPALVSLAAEPRVEERAPVPRVKTVQPPNTGARFTPFSRKGSIASETEARHAPIINSSVMKEAETLKVMYAPAVKKQAVPAEKGPGPEVRTASHDLPADLQFVTVQSGQTLSKIIIAAYGRFDETILAYVINHNPALTNPDRIQAGQVIKLPNPSPATSAASLQPPTSDL